MKTQITTNYDGISKPSLITLAIDFENQRELEIYCRLFNQSVNNMTDFLNNDPNQDETEPDYGTAVTKDEVRTCFPMSIWSSLHYKLQKLKEKK